MIRISPHFYQTRLFYWAVGLTAILLIWIAEAFRVKSKERRLTTIMAERSRVAQELHDTLLQSVSGAAMEIQAGLRHLNSGASQLGTRQLSTALDHLGKSMADARQAIWDLKSPDSSSDLRIDVALEKTARRLCEGGPALHFAVTGSPKKVSQCLEKSPSSYQYLTTVGDLTLHQLNRQPYRITGDWTACGNGQRNARGD